LNTEVYDGIVQVAHADAVDIARRLASEEGVLAGVSSGAACWAALQVAARLGKGARVVTILPDVGERYLTTSLFDRKSGS